MTVFNRCRCCSCAEAECHLPSICGRLSYLLGGPVGPIPEEGFLLGVLSGQGRFLFVVLFCRVLMLSQTSFPPDEGITVTYIIYRLFTCVVRGRVMVVDHSGRLQSGA